MNMNKNSSNHTRLPDIKTNKCMEFRKMVTITLYAKQKETQMYRTEFWTLWEKVRVGCFESIETCILSRVKQITSPG